MPRNAKKLTKRSLDALRPKAETDTSFTAYVVEAGQPGLYAWARRGRVEARLPRAEADEPVCPGAVPGQPFIGIDRTRRKLWEAAGLEGVDSHSPAPQLRLDPRSHPVRALRRPRFRLSWVMASSLGRSPKGPTPARGPETLAGADLGRLALAHLER